MYELGHTAGGLDLVDNPIPVAGGLHRHRGGPLTPPEKLPEGAPFMVNPLLADQPVIRSGHRRQGVVLVRVKGDILHGLRLLSAAFGRWVCPRARYLVRVRRRAALSSHHLTRPLFRQTVAPIERLAWHPA